MRAGHQTTFTPTFLGAARRASASCMRWPATPLENTQIIYQDCDVKVQRKCSYA